MSLWVLRTGGHRGESGVETILTMCYKETSVRTGSGPDRMGMGGKDNKKPNQIKWLGVPTERFPKQVRYQAALHPEELFLYIFCGTIVNTKDPAGGSLKDE